MQWYNWFFFRGGGGRSKTKPGTPTGQINTTCLRVFTTKSLLLAHHLVCFVSVPLLYAVLVAPVPTHRVLRHVPLTSQGRGLQKGWRAPCRTPGVPCRTAASRVCWNGRVRGVREQRARGGRGLVCAGEVWHAQQDHDRIAARPTDAIAMDQRPEIQTRHQRRAGQRVLGGGRPRVKGHSVTPAPRTTRTQ